MAKKVLIICEGVDKEPKIFARVKALGFLPQDVEVVSYGTNIYNWWRSRFFSLRSRMRFTRSGRWQVSERCWGVSKFL